MKQTAVYLNGSLLGFHDKPLEFVNGVKDKRRKGELPHDLNIAYYKDTNEIYLNADEGRATRPLIIVENGKSKFTKEHKKLLKAKKLKFSDLLKSGVVEFLDAEEEENAYIAVHEKDLTPEHTHLEIHPSLMLGVTAALGPFPEHNSAPRVTMTTAMLKQALGFYATNYKLRTDRNGHVLYYPQVPIAQTKYTPIVQIDKKAAGQNFVIAVMPFRGYNINDALVINKASVDRGLGRSVYYQTYESEERKYPGGQKDRFERPNPEIPGYRGEEAYKYLDEEGIVEPNFDVKGGDVLVGKTSPPRFLEEVGEFGVIEEKRRENSEAVTAGETGTVDLVMLTEGPGGNKLSRIKTRRVMTPEIGDKFAARHGQKGVIGMLVDERDMPFSEQGTIPDLCLNPHAIPGRMTAGYLLETIGAKAGAMRGTDVDATAFDDESQESLEEQLKKYGFSRTGTEIMYDGITGEPVRAQIFTGVVYYQKLYHMVSKKIHARARGPIQILTRQPTEGKAREGGLKFGEMERDVLIGHGTTMLLMDRLLEQSDKETELICEKCGTIAINDQIRKKKYCPLCGQESTIKPIEISYAFKLMLNELKAMCIFPKIKLKDKV